MRIFVWFACRNAIKRPLCPISLSLSHFVRGPHTSNRCLKAAHRARSFRTERDSAQGRELAECCLRNEFLLEILTYSYWPRLTFAVLVQKAGLML